MCDCQTSDSVYDGTYFRVVDPVSQSQPRRRTTLSLNKRDLDPLAEDEENDMDEDTDSFTDNEGEWWQWLPVMCSEVVTVMNLNYSFLFWIYESNVIV